MDLPPSLWKYSADPRPPLSFPDPGSELVCVSWCHWVQSVPSFLGVWEVVSMPLLPSAGQVQSGCQWVLSLPNGKLAAREKKQTPASSLEKASEARILAVLNGTGSLCMTQGPAACSCMPHPGLSLIQEGFVAAAQSRVYFVCNYLTRKPRSCSEQVSADRPMSLPRDPCS